MSRGEEGGDGASERVRELANEGGCWTRGEGGEGGEGEGSEQASARASEEGRKRWRARGRARERGIEQGSEEVSEVMRDRGIEGVWMEAGSLEGKSLGGERGSGRGDKGSGNARQRGRERDSEMARERNGR